jgi:hypothetical protein
MVVTVAPAPDLQGTLASVPSLCSWGPLPYTNRGFSGRQILLGGCDWHKATGGCKKPTSASHHLSM